MINFDFNQIYTTIVAVLPSVAAIGTMVSTAAKLKSASASAKDETLKQLKSLQNSNAEEIKKLLDATKAQSDAAKLEKESLQNKIGTLSKDNQALRDNIDKLTKQVTKVVDKVNVK